MNEGHAGFMALERIRVLMHEHGLSFAEARAAVRPGSIFTTHTPVPAGIDRFPRELVEKYFSGWCRDVGLTPRRPHGPGPRAGHARGRGLQHGRHGPAPGRPGQRRGRPARRGEPRDVQRPVARRARRGGADHVGHQRRARPHLDLAGAGHPVRQGARRRLARGSGRGVARARHREREGAGRGSGGWARSASSPTPARRCARPSSTGARPPRRWRGPTTCSTPTSSPSASPAGSPPTSGPRCCSATSTGSGGLLLDEERPVQLIFAGKAHPADEPGHHLLQEVAKLASELDIRHRLVLLEDYDISVARMLVQGCDVWLNTPLRPNEACGTSGMKVVFNGGLNCSILDGWWDEMYDPEVGWAIPSAETGDDIEQRNDLESQSVYSILERQIVPLYYRRDDDGLNVEWLRRVKRSIVKLSPQVESTRMLREYVERALRARRGRTPSAWGRRRLRPHPLARAVGPPPRPGVALGGRGRHQRRRALRQLPAGSPSPPRSCSATSTRPTSTCRPSTARSTSTTTCSSPAPPAWTSPATATIPGWRRYQLSIVDAPGRQLRLHRPHRAPPRRRRELRAARSRGLGPLDGLTRPPEPRVR